jgi:hypothetical protein
VAWRRARFAEEELHLPEVGEESRAISLRHIPLSPRSFITNVYDVVTSSSAVICRVSRAISEVYTREGHPATNLISWRNMAEAVARL